MKNNVVRWDAHGSHSSSNDCTQHAADPDDPPRAPPHRRTDSTRKSKAAVAVCATACRAPSAIKCDINDNKQEITFRSSYLLVHRSVKSPSSRRIGRRAGSSDLASFIEITPGAAPISSSFPSHSPAFGASRCSRGRDSNRRTVGFGSLSATRLLFICLQISCLVFLCNLNVGMAVSLNSDVDADLPFFELDYQEPEASEQTGHYTHTWAVHIPNGDSGLADEVARDHGFVNLGKIFDDHYHFAHNKVTKRSLTPASTHQSKLEEDERVHWAAQQKAKSRRKRDFIRMRPSRTSSRMVSLVDSVSFSDPKWAQMWYLNRGGGLDMNVIPAWKEGITGKGVVVTILDDGLELNHPDIEHNYDPKASYDVNSHDENPMPQYDMTDSNRHGTRCAGEVAATANNSLCAVGIAFGASVGGVRMLDGDVTDAVEARSLSLNPQHIDIYSASWGPDDDGKTVDGPGELASRAFIEGVTKGRNGKGSIFIWASGNGGRELDNCNCDGYTNSIWTLSISSATEVGNVPWYSEKCSSTLATTYSSGGPSEKQVVTTDLHHSCTISHTGTSASAPLAAGIAALVLESNQNLTWRDLQHIVVRTAKPANLHDPTWSKNGVGRRISHSFGYGLMDAAAMVKVARTWKTVPEQQRCEINAPHVDKVIPPKGYITLQLTVKHCLSVNYLEHVQAKITLTSQRRGDIQLYLKSPAGTKVTLLTSRIHDVSRSGFNQWPFMSVHTWGESPHGNWQLEIHNQGRYMAQITQWDLIFYGTEIPAQPDDPIQISPEKLSPYGNDMENNHLSFDSDTVSGQWRHVEQVGESSNMSSDRTSTACLKATIDQRCLVCAFPTFIYNGRCYLECPPHTYKLLSQRESTRPEAEPFMDSQQTDRKRSLQAIEYRANNDIGASMEERACGECDKSCLRCYGPLNSECSTCYPGSQLRKALLSNETYCYVFAERSSGNSQDGATNNANINAHRGKFAMFVVIIVPAMAVVAFLIFVSTVVRKNLTWFDICNRRDGEYTYDRVALLPEFDQETELEEGTNVKDVEKTAVPEVDIECKETP